MATHYRFAAREDSETIRMLIEQAYRDPATAGRWDSESHLLTGPRTSIEEISGLIADIRSRFLVAEIGGRIESCALIQLQPVDLRAPEAPPRTYFGMFAVSAAHRSAGLGKAMLKEAERAVREEWGAAAMSLTVISIRTELIAWYERRGFRRTGRTTPFPFQPHSGALRRDFDLVEMEKALA